MRDLPVVLSDVHSVPHEVNKHILLVSVFIDFVKPLSDVVKGLLLGHIIDYQCGLARFVEEFSDGSELFLTGRVPYLKLDDMLPVQTHGEGSELHPYGYLMIGLESTLSKHLHQATLANSGIPDDNNLELGICLKLHIRVLFNWLSLNAGKLLT